MATAINFPKSKSSSLVLLVWAALFLNNHQTFGQNQPPRQTSIRVKESQSRIQEKAPPKNYTKIIEAAGLHDVQAYDSTILVDLKYATTDNFLGINLYSDLKKAYLQPEVAKKLAEASRLLQQSHPTYRLLVYDAARPRQVQQVLWDNLKMPRKQKTKYVADPAIGSIHNYGSAVDLTLAHQNGQPLDMGTPFDYFGPLAYPVREQEMLENGKLTLNQVKNRLLLREVMVKAGFTGITSEWWHFNALSRDQAQKIYKIIE